MTQQARSDAGAAIPGGIGLVPLRTLVTEGVDASFDLHPGDVALVADGDHVSADVPIALRLRDPRTAVVAGPAASDEVGVPGGRWSAGPGRRGRETETDRAGELLFRSGGRWRIASGEHTESLVAPVSGTIHDVRPGIGLRLRSVARGIGGVETLAGPTSGRLAIMTGPDGEVRAPHVDVSVAGAVLVAGARIDAEALTRARAVGVRGVVVAALGVKERRDFLASEGRGRAAVHGLPPFAILVLDGAAGRPISGPMMAILRALEGRSVAILGDPPCLAVDDPTVDLPRPPEEVVWVRSGPMAGAEGRWAGLAGPRRFSGVLLEAGLVRFGDRPPVAVPLGDLERFA